MTPQTIAASIVLLFITVATSFAQQPMLRWKQDVPSTEKECIARGGRWGSVGIPGNPYPPECTLATSDSGKICKNTEDCQGYCVVPGEISPTPSRSYSQGICSDHYPMFGCVTYLQDGKVISMCRD
jgi:hypothetical protein